MIREVGFIVDYGYDFLTADVIKSLKKQFLLSNESLLDELNIQDKSSWTKKEINTLNDISKRFPAIKSIFSDLYNKSSSDSKADKRFLLLKELNTYHEFLKVFPYSEDKDFQNKIFSMILNNHLKLGVEKNLDLIKEGFKQFLDLSSMKELVNHLSQSEIDNPTSISIKHGNLIRKQSDKRMTIIKVAAASLAVPAAGGISSFPLLVIANNALHNITFTTHALSALGLLGSTMFAYYGMKKIMENVITAYDNHHVHYLNIKEKNDKIKSKGLISYSLCQNFIHDKSYHEKDDRTDLLIFCYLNEKLTYLFGETNQEPVFPNELRKLLPIEQVKKIKSMNVHDIHKISTFTNDELREVVLFNKINYEQFNLLRLLDQSIFISHQYQINLRDDIVPYLKDEKLINFFKNDKVNLVEKEILKAYLMNNLMSSTSGKFIPDDVTDNILKNDTVNYQEIYQKTLTNFDSKYKNFTKNKEKTVIHRLLDKDLINHTKKKIEEEELKKINNKILNDIKNVSLQYNYTETLKTIRKVPSIIEEIIPSLTTTATSTIDIIKDTVDDPISKLKLK